MGPGSARQFAGRLGNDSGALVPTGVVPHMDCSKFSDAHCNKVPTRLGIGSGTRGTPQDAEVNCTSAEMAGTNDGESAEGDDIPKELGRSRAGASQTCYSANATSYPYSATGPTEHSSSACGGSCSSLCVWHTGYTGGIARSGCRNVWNCCEGAWRRRNGGGRNGRPHCKGSARCNGANATADYCAPERVCGPRKQCNGGGGGREATTGTDTRATADRPGTCSFLTARAGPEVSSVTVEGTGTPLVRGQPRGEQSSL